MAIVLEGTPTLAEGGSTAFDISVPYPTGITAGELLLASICFSQEFIGTTPPADWLLMADHQNATANTMSQAVYYKIATGSESGSVTFEGDPDLLQDGRITGRMSRWSGVDTTNPIDVAAVMAGTSPATSLTMPSITTANDGAMLIHSLCLNSTTVQVATHSGTTKFGSNTTGTGRSMSTFYEERATAGATGTKNWTNGGTSTQWGGITVALRPAGGGPATPTLNRCINDIPGTTSMVVSVNTTDASSVRLKVGTDTAVTTGVIFGGAETPDGNNNSELTVTGLSANTRYYYRIAMTNSGTETLDNWSDVGTFKTDLNGQLSFTVGFASCCNLSDSDSLDAIATKLPDMFLHLGDLYYDDGASNAVSNFRSEMGGKMQATNHKKVARTSGWSYIPSDHDGLNNNNNAYTHPTHWANWNTVYREVFPNTDLPTNGVYRSFKRGRVRFIRIDRRSLADNPADTDDTNKTCLGATQRAWLDNEITNCSEPVIIIQNPEAWIIDPDTGAESWGGYTTERAEIAAVITASGKHVVMLGGDMHAVGFDDGTNSDGGIPVYQAAPLAQAASIKGGPYSGGVYPASGSTNVQQYGWLDITDTGTTIEVEFTGYSSDNTVRKTHTSTFTVEVSAEATGIASAEAFGTPEAIYELTATANGIASEEAFGTPSTDNVLLATATAIESSETFGTPSVGLGALTATATAIESEETFGTPANVGDEGFTIATGIPTEEAFGTPSATLVMTATATGIASAEAFGTPIAKDPDAMLTLPLPKNRYSAGDLEFEFYRQQSGLEAGTFNDHKYAFLSNTLGYDEDIDFLEYQYWKSISPLPAEGYSLADHRQATFEEATAGEFNDDGRTYFLQFFF